MLKHGEMLFLLTVETTTFDWMMMQLQKLNTLYQGQILDELHAEAQSNQWFLRLLHTNQHEVYEML